MMSLTPTRVRTQTGEHCLLFGVPAIAFQETESAFHLPQPVSQTVQSVNKMRHFVWTVLQNCNSQNYMLYFEEM